MPTRPSAVPTVQITNSRTRVTEWRFPPGAETGTHRHEHDYVVVPQTTGRLIVRTAEGETENALTTGIPYYREAGATHNVINPNDTEFVFVEIENLA